MKIKVPPFIRIENGHPAVAFASRSGAIETTWVDPGVLDGYVATAPPMARDASSDEPPPGVRIRYRVRVDLSPGVGLTFATEGNDDCGYGLTVASEAAPRDVMRLTDASLDVLRAPTAVKIDEHRALVAFYASQGDDANLMVMAVGVP